MPEAVRVDSLVTITAFDAFAEQNDAVRPASSSGQVVG